MQRRRTPFKWRSLSPKPVAVAEWVARQTAEQEVGGSNPGIPPLLKHACGEGDWLLCWHYTPANVSYQRWISGNVYHVRLRTVQIRQNPLWLWNPEETSPEVQNRGINGPTKKKKKKKKKDPFHLQKLVFSEGTNSPLNTQGFQMKDPFHLKITLSN